MSDINSLITPHNIQSELIKNEIEQNNLMVEAFREQKYNELLKENQKLKDKINKAVEYIEKHKQVYDIDGSVEPKLDDFDILASPKYLINLLKGDKNE